MAIQENRVIAVSYSSVMTDSLAQNARAPVVVGAAQMDGCAASIDGSNAGNMSNPASEA